MGFFQSSNPNLYIAITLSIINGILLCFAGFKCLHIIQLSGYKISGYREWLSNTHARYISRLAMLSLMSLACMLVTNALFQVNNNRLYFSYFGLIFYFYFSIVFIVNMYAVQKKVPLVQTHRMTRLCVTLGFLIASLTFILIAFATEYVGLLRFAVIALMPITLPILVAVAHFTNLPFEIMLRKHFVRKAKNILKKRPDLIKIGITGSVGKTSVKYILNKMLSKKYSVCMSPHSFNTEMGLAKVITKYLEPNNQILIAEMGATEVGDIAKLCKMIEPQHGIITNVEVQHLLTFGSEENIARTKNELSIAVNGMMVFNGDNLKSISLYEMRDRPKTYVSISNKKAPIYTKNIRCNSSGSNFTLMLNGQEIECHTKLLGKHNILNILLCTALANYLGINAQDICASIAELEAIPHRLEIKESNGMTIIDNSFNSSPTTSLATLEVVEKFKNKNKVFITPGLVELGKLENEQNKILGANIAKFCTHCIIVNKTNEESIKSGLIEANFSQDCIFCASTIAEAVKLLNSLSLKNPLVIFENDLPDNYT
ncbi:MAG: UDP-N-acetylmuramoyl-tripeptide--D-alanyl-D-alanine ligase [Clostridia bacterium]